MAHHHESDLGAPAWDNSDIYPSLASKEYQSDFERLSSIVAELEKHAAGMLAALENAGALKSALPAAEAFLPLRREGRRLRNDLYTFASCEGSIDATSAEPKRRIAAIQELGGKFDEACVVLRNFLLRLDDAEFAAFLDAPLATDDIFGMSYERAYYRDRALGLAEERFLKAFQSDGFVAWENLYFNIAGSMQCKVSTGGKEEILGLAETAGHLYSPAREKREGAWRAIRAAWQANLEPAAASINSLSGWRLKVAERRSHSVKTTFLDEPLFDNRHSKQTLEALVGAAREAIPASRRALQLLAKALKLQALSPWDLQAPPPAALLGERPAPLHFDEARRIVRDAYIELDDEAGKFVDLVFENSWFEGRALPNKRPGAYCCGFLKTSSPRIYMTYTGSLGEVRTMAHELGHAYHSWVMRDLPVEQQGYPMSLAETASTIGEYFVARHLERQANSPRLLLPGLWQEVQDGLAFLVNIPARFEFEHEVYERRADQYMTAADLSELMRTSWQRWYADALAEYDEFFWASKLHFFLSDLSFYNFPYLFGYLFGLGIVAQRSALGSEFHDRYVALLRDTGRMSAEDIARQHLRADIQKPEFWRASAGMFAERVVKLENVLAELGVE